eukprot:gnl/MRDRNA2_/MRDRNA2_68213_c0_seq1.p1 gnl/MRDRNA2_/MRDRNA2_68213_c0~~gnl/MRDRNA2_/MRDRNA2_68213_c0_seq1.p1  ORF type:complete len:204 (-),score=33.55 gnl/MRDRNA2_/MRDRNA2_68213_c0_seq1:406-984(-)
MLHPAWDIYRQWHTLAEDERIMKVQKARWNYFVCSVIVEWARAALVLPPPLVTDSGSQTDEPDADYSEIETHDPWEGLDVHRVMAEWVVDRPTMTLPSRHRGALHHRQLFMRVPGNGLTAELMEIVQGMRSQQESVRTAPQELFLYQLTALLCHAGMHCLARNFFAVKACIAWHGERGAAMYFFLKIWSMWV